MNNIIAKGNVRKSMTEAASGKTCYLPHHGDYHPNKPGKIRVVFDLSADYKGRCLNREPHKRTMHVIHEVQGAPEHTGCEALEAQDHAIHEAYET